MYKLGEWLADSETIAMLTSGTVRSLTYKANQFGPNITKDGRLPTPPRGTRSMTPTSVLRSTSFQRPNGMKRRRRSPPRRRALRRLTPRRRQAVAVALAVALAVAVAVATRSCPLSQKTC